jgi:hypothetical protein
MNDILVQKLLLFWLNIINISLFNNAGFPAAENAPTEDAVYELL